MRLSPTYLSALVSLLIIPAAARGVLAAPPSGFQKFAAGHCAECHNAGTHEGGLNLAALAWQPAEQANFDRWVKIYDRVDRGEMPPQSEPRPPQADAAAALKALGGALRAANVAVQRQQGRVIMRRLNRVEYENSLHDLLGIDLPLADVLPGETPLEGFDTVADGLRLSPLHMEKYLEAADAALDAAIRLDREPERINKRFLYKEQEGIRKNLGTEHSMCRELDDAIVLFNGASYITKIFGLHLKETGMYRLRASAYAFQTDKPVVLRLYAGDYRRNSVRLLGYFDMPVGQPREVEIVTRLNESEYLYPAPDDLDQPPKGQGLYGVGGDKWEGAGLALQWIEVEGPLLDRWPPPSVDRLFPAVPVEPLTKEDLKKHPSGRRPLASKLVPKDPPADVRRVVEHLAARAFRRPLAAGEADGLVKLATDALEQGKSFKTAARIGFRAVLTAPQFLMFDEQPGKLDDYALAARLAYFLWSTMPDDELLATAAEHKLSQPAVLRAQVERMLASTKSRGLVEDFVGQWLELRNIDATMPDMRMYPEFDELLKVSMVEETQRFFQTLVDDDLSASNLIHSDFAILNRRLAEHYGIAGVAGEQFRRVSLSADSHRGGVLTQASVLKVTANGTVTSPVLRGSWVLKHLLSQPPPPPPADVGSIEPDTRGTTTIREQLAAHRNSAVCASCHKTIDPPGFALESFDVIGGWRERYRSQDKGDRPTTRLHGRLVGSYKLGPAADTSGELADGRKFQGIDDFKQLLLAQKEQVARSVVRNLLVYGTGAGIQFADREDVEAILARARQRDYGMRTLLHEVVQSPTFQNK